MDISRLGSCVSAEDIRNFLWQEGDLRYKFDALQKHISARISALDPGTKKAVILSSRQIGKSFFSMGFSTAFLLRSPKAIARVMAPTRTKCEEIVEDNLNVVFADAPPGLVARSVSKNRWNFYNGSSLRLGALEKQYVDKNRGGNAGLVIYEECGFVPSDEFYYGVNSVVGPQLLRSNGFEFFITSPSPNPDHPVHAIADEADAMGSLFRFHVFESPSISDEAIIEAALRSGCLIPLDFVERVRSERMKSEEIVDYASERGIYLSDDFQREYLALIIRPKNLMIIPNFRDSCIQTKYEMANYSRRLITIDWGGVRDKTVALVSAYDAEKDLDIFLEELVFDQNTPTSTIVDQIRELQSRYGDPRIVADVPGQLKIDLQSRFNLRVSTPKKTNWMSSINLMAARFATNRAVIDPRCEFLIKSIRGGLFNRTRTDFARTTELGHMDALAACMYAMRAVDRSPIKNNHSYSGSATIFVKGREPENSLKKLQGRNFFRS